MMLVMADDQAADLDAANSLIIVTTADEMKYENETMQSD